LMWPQRCWQCQVRRKKLEGHLVWPDWKHLSFTTNPEHINSYTTVSLISKETRT
jgi:hypothetical protein